MKFLKATLIVVVVFFTITYFFFMENKGGIEPVLDNSKDRPAFEIEYVYNKDGRAFFDRIDFKNTSTGEIINSFDPLKNNPYNHLNFPVIKKDAFGCKIYDLSKVKKENYPDLLEKIQMPAYTRNHVLSGARSRVYVYYKGKHYTLVSYSLSIYNTRGQILGAKSELVALNSKGEIIQRFKNDDVGERTPIITDNGKYALIHYGGIFGESGEVLEEGFRFYDVQNGTIIKDEKVGNKAFGNPYEKHNLFFLVAGAGHDYEYNIFDLDKRIIYVKTFLRGHRPRFDDIEEDGVSLIDERGYWRKFLFEKDFLIKKF